MERNQIIKQKLSIAGMLWQTVAVIAENFLNLSTLSDTHFRGKFPFPWTEPVVGMSPIQSSRK